MRLRRRIGLRWLAAAAGLYLALAGGAFAAPAPSGHTIGHPPEKRSAATEALAAQADAWYQQRETPGAAAQAARLYEQVLRANPSDYGSWWRLARSEWWLGDHSDRQGVSWYAACEWTASRAKQLEPGAAEGHFWYGACAGRSAQQAGLFGGLGYAESSRRAMETVLRLDPRHPGALYVLGVLYREVPGWPWSFGDLGRSLHYARLAVQADPDNVQVRIGLAETLMAAGQKAEAREILQKALTLRGTTDQQPETKEEKAKLRRLLAAWR